MQTLRKEELLNSVFPHNSNPLGVTSIELKSDSIRRWLCYGFKSRVDKWPILSFICHHLFDSSSYHISFTRSCQNFPRCNLRRWRQEKTVHFRLHGHASFHSSKFTINTYFFWWNLRINWKFILYNIDVYYWSYIGFYFWYSFM